ncbi:MAG: GAF domain-containing protein [Anaerolineae bacterium]|nr:GAF domain-containing protein [Anaerolineae bacterium]
MAALRLVVPILGVGVLLLYRDYPIWAFILASVAVALIVGMAFRQQARRWAAVLADAQEEVREANSRNEALADEIDALATAHRATQKRISYQEASLSATQQLGMCLRLGELLERAPTVVATHFGYDEAQIYLLDSAGEWATLVSTSRAYDGDMVAQGYRLRTDGDTLVGWVAIHRQPKAARSDGRASGVAAQAVPTSPSALALPLESGGQILGVIVLLTQRETDASREELIVLEALADHLAQMIDYARGLRDEATASEVGGPLLGTANLLATARSEGDVYDAFIDVLRDAGPARVLVVRSVGGDEALRVVMDYQGQSANRVPTDLGDLDPPSLVDLALVGLALESPLWAEDLTNLDPLLSPELGRVLRDVAEPGRSAGLALIPLRAESTRAEGEIIVFYGKAHRFGSAERRLHELLVDFGGAALERARLIASARKWLDLAQQRVVIEARIARAADVESILKVAVRDLARALRAVDGEIRLSPGVPVGSSVQNPDRDASGQVKAWGGS